MVVISKTALNLFGEKHPDVTTALNDWYDIVKNADWQNLAALRRTFNSVDYIADNRYVFNIKGNHYRLVAMIFFSVRTVYIKFIGTHAEYDKVDVAAIDLKDS
ncbi:type II toxin-antitoxin system HigB family toxin [Spirosoma areae]